MCIIFSFLLLFMFIVTKKQARRITITLRTRTYAPTAKYGGDDTSPPQQWCFEVVCGVVCAVDARNLLGVMK